MGWKVAKTESIGGSSSSVTGRRRHWLLEPEVLLLVLLVVGIYFTRMSSLTIRGEETRRATIAREMITSGDWVVPTQQGEPYITRPPLQNWAIAAIGLATGEVDEIAVRLPSAMAILLTTLLVYWYARAFLTRLGAFASAAAFTTFGQVLELGRLGETDAMLTMCVAGSLLLWHGGRMRGRSELWCWIAGYAMAGLGFMTKGPQPPVYFAGPVVAYLLLTRHWRELFRWQQFAGIATFAIVVGVWMVPFAGRTGIDGVLAILGYEVGVRLGDTGVLAFVKHLLLYPVEIFFAGLIPWAILLVAYLDPKFRRALGTARDPARFLGLVVVVTFPTCWFVAGAENRLCVSILPMVAPLVGLVVQRCYESIPPGLFEKLFRPFAIVMTLLVSGVCIAGLATAWMDPALSYLIQPPVLAIGTMIAAAVGMAVIWSALHGRSPAQGRAVVLFVAALSGLFYAGPVTTARINRSADAARDIALVERQLPPDSRLVSLGTIHHLFSYHCRVPIELRQWPTAADEIDPAHPYFCFTSGSGRTELPIAWEQIAEISCDRSITEHPGGDCDRRTLVAATGNGRRRLSDSPVD